MNPQGCSECGVPHSSTVPHMVGMEVPLYHPGQTTPMAVVLPGDTPEVREWLEGQAIPKCRQWREANPEPRCWCDEALACPENHSHRSKADRAAPYCCSAYCDRCAGLRALDGVNPLLPNDWMRQ